MTTDKNFADRLQRIEQTHGVSATSPDRYELPKHLRKDNKRPKVTLISSGWIITAAIVGGYFVLALGFKSFGESMARTVDPSPRSALAQEAPDLMTRLARNVVQSGVSTPSDFLPPAPEGWVRVTPDDALDDSLRSRLAVAWPDDARPLKKNAGFRDLVQFVEAFRQDDLETRRWLTTGTRAFYLDPDGYYFSLDLMRLSHIGDEQITDDWFTGLEALVRDKDRQPEVAARYMIGDLPAVASQILEAEGPEGPVFDITGDQKMLVALGPRAIAEIHGVGAPEDLAHLIGAIDVSAFRD